MASSTINLWQETTLGEVIEIHDYKRVPLSTKQRSKRSGPYPYYGASGVIDYVDDYLFDGRYLLVSEDGENLNSRKTPIAFFASGRFWVNNHAHIIRARPNVADDYFLMSWLQSSNISGYITGAAQPKLSQANLKSIKLYLPPLSTQRKIASVLSAYDDLIENNTRRIEILEEMAQRIYREWFVHFRFPGHEKFGMVKSELGPIPPGWAVRKLENVCAKLASGGTPARKQPDYWGGHIGWFKTKELKDGFLFRSEELVTDEGLRRSSAKLFPAGTVLMAIYAAPTVGRLGILTEPATFNQAACGLVADPQQLTTSFLYLKLYELRGYFNNLAQGAAQQNISVQKVRDSQMVLPTLDVIEKFDVIASPLLLQVKTLSEKNANLRHTRDLLLPKLISGEVDVQNLNGEIGGEEY